MQISFFGLVYYILVTLTTLLLTRKYTCLA